MAPYTAAFTAAAAVVVVVAVVIVVVVTAPWRFNHFRLIPFQHLRRKKATTLCSGAVFKLLTIQRCATLAFKPP